LIVEPLLQGAGGMLMYSPDFLHQLFTIARKAGVLIIADEVFTGFYRTGKAFACSHIESSPDMVCLSKGLTGGFLPMGITLCNAHTAAPFAEKNYAKTLYHGHSFTGNPLSCAAAIASLELCQAEGFEDKVNQLALQQSRFAERLNDRFPTVQARNCGTITALTLGSEESGYDYTHPIRQRMYAFFMERNLLIRPMGNVVYLAPPYCIEAEDLGRAHAAMEELLSVLEKG
jgi:adenosylmethionine-8-amino-7-oxononanoate aminotransferase